MEKKKVSFVQGAAILGIAGLIVKVIGAAFRIPLANTIGLIGTSYYDTAYPYYSWLLVISSSGLAYGHFQDGVRTGHPGGLPRRPPGVYHRHADPMLHRAFNLHPDVLRLGLHRPAPHAA